MQDPITQIRTWYIHLPPFTRIFITTLIVVSILVTFNIVNTGSLIYDVTSTFRHLELWRLVTSFCCYGKLSLNLLFAGYFAYFALTKVQRELFQRADYADFLVLLIYLWVTILLGATLLGLPFLGNSFTFALLYVWCRRKPFEPIRFFFGWQIRSGYFPIIFMGFNVLMGQSLLVFLLGLAFGHLFIVVKDELTVRYRRDFLGTPIFFTNFVRRYIIKQRGRGQQPAGNRVIIP